MRTIGEIVAVAGILLGLVFVGWEIRQNTAATRSATQQAVYEGGIQSNLNVMNNERLRDLLVLTSDNADWAATAPRDSLSMGRARLRRLGRETLEVTSLDLR